MNAFAPPVRVLDTLAQIVNKVKVLSIALPADLTPLLEDEELLAWYDRMAELERAPARQVVRLNAYAERKKAELTPIMISPEGQAVGYTLSAEHPTEGVICTYAEATSLLNAFQRCIEEFPLEEGHRDHKVKDEAGIETLVVWQVVEGSIKVLSPYTRNVMLTQTQIDDAGPPSDFVQRALSTALDLGGDDGVVDTGPGALSLDDE